MHSFLIGRSPGQEVRSWIDRAKDLRILSKLYRWRRFFIGSRPLWVCVFKVVDPRVFLGGYEYSHDAVLSTNENWFVLDRVEERAKALSGSGKGNSLHIPI